ncbi:hypothetical protein BH11PLA2_BH11PLA2_17560 [soil metagenome]
MAINGFDPVYRKAGDDVDVCWRLQQAGYWITFAPGAFVWHHRRHSPRAYLKQQAGYGEAEALLWFKHPDRFTSRGHGKWRGILYGDSLQGLTLSRPIIYRGTFAAGLFQTIYQPGPAHWAMLPSTLEWHAVALALALMAIPFPVIGLAVGFMIALSVLVALMQAWQAHLPGQHDSLRSRLLVAGLCYAQPVVRSWCRYQTRLFSESEPAESPKPLPEGRQSRMPLTGSRSVTYWSEAGVGRFELLHGVVKYLGENRWGKTLDSGWADWDLQVHCHPWTVVELRTAQEDHGGNHHLTRVNFRLRPSAYLNLLGITGAVAAGIALSYGLVGTVEPWVWSATAFASLCAIAGVVFWISGARRASQVLAVVDREATTLGLFRFSPNAPAPGTPKLLRRGLLPRLGTAIRGVIRTTPLVRLRSQPAIVVREHPPVLVAHSLTVTAEGEARA